MSRADRYFAKLFLVGPLQLTDAAGKTLTPRSKKACALLALLALAPRRQRTRVWLRDKLWSESCERKSATSLRQLIFELRRELGPLFDAAFQVDRQFIGLRSDAVWIDYHAVHDDPYQLRALSILPETELLEGIDIQDEEFEDWLLLERQIWMEKSAELFSRASNASAAAISQLSPAEAVILIPTPEPRISLGILPNIQQGCDENTAFIADHLLEGIVQNLRELHPIDAFDLRDANSPSDSLIHACNTEYFVRVRALQIRQTLTLTFFFYQAHNMSLEWSQSIQTSVDDVLDWDSYVLSGFVTQNVDRILRQMDRRAPPEQSPQEAKRFVAGYTALNMMFRLDQQALENAEYLLTRDEADPNNAALFAAMRSYAASFRIGENLGPLDADAVAETAQLARNALSQNPFNAIALACLGHAMGYVFHDHSLARDLLERAIKLNPNQAFVWDHYALHKLYSGDYKAAHKAAERAVFLGSYSPISYSYDTTLAMTSTMLGNAQKAIQASQNALKKQPNFNAAMRYLLVNLAKTNREDEAARIYQTLLRRDPQFSDVEVQKARFRILQKPKEAELIKAISWLAD